MNTHTAERRLQYRT